jgi:hypothetical protein
MPSVIKLFLISILSTTFFGCVEKKSMATRGMSGVPTSQFSYMGPVERTIDLKLQLSKAKFSDAGAIRAVISLPYDYNHPLQYKWKLGQNVKLQKGQSLTGLIPSIKKDTPVEITLSVDNFQASEARFVRFEVFGTNPNKRIFSDGIVSSNQENAFESIVQEVEKIHAEK